MARRRAECVAFIKPAQDANEAKTLILQDFSRQPNARAHCENMLRLNADCMAFLADTHLCRRLRLLRHFGESPVRWPQAALADAHQQDPPRGECVVAWADVDDDAAARCGFCDVCLSRGTGARGNSVDPGSRDEADFTEECKLLLRCVQACGGLTGAKTPAAMVAGHAIQQVRSKGLQRHAMFGCGKRRPLQWWQEFFRYVKQAGFLLEKAMLLQSGIPYAAVSVSQEGCALLEGRGPRFVLKPVPEQLMEKVVAPPPKIVEVRSCAVSRDVPSPDELFRRLSHVRLQWMRRQGICGEAILPNPVLRRFAELRPTSVAAARARVEGLPAALAEDLIAAAVDETKRFCTLTGLQPDIGGGSAGVGGPAKRPVAEVEAHASDTARQPAKIPRCLTASGVPLHDAAARKECTSAARPATSADASNDFRLDALAYKADVATQKRYASATRSAASADASNDSRPDALACSADVATQNTCTSATHSATRPRTDSGVRHTTRAATPVSAPDAGWIAPRRAFSKVSFPDAAEGKPTSSGPRDGKPSLRRSVPWLKQAGDAPYQPLPDSGQAATLSTSAATCPPAAGHGSTAPSKVTPFQAADVVLGEMLQTPTRSHAVAETHTRATVREPAADPASLPSAAPAARAGADVSRSGGSEPQTLEEALAELAEARLRIQQLEAERSGATLARPQSMLEATRMENASAFGANARTDDLGEPTSAKNRSESGLVPPDVGTASVVNAEDSWLAALDL